MNDDRGPYDQAEDALRVLNSLTASESRRDAALDDIFDLLGDERARIFLNAHGIHPAAEA